MLLKKKSFLSFIVSFALLAIVTTVFLSACGSSNSHHVNDNANNNVDTNTSTADNRNSNNSLTRSAKTVTDAMGHQITIPADPQHIIGSYLEDPLVALGITPAAQWSVANGKTVQDYLQEQLKGVPTISYNLPPEEVMSFNPDLILIGSPTSVQNGLYDQYAKIAPTYVLGDDINNDWRKTLSKIGELLNKQDEAAQAIQAYDQKAKDAKDNLHQAIGDKSAAILWLTQKQFYIVDASRSSGAVLYGDLGLKTPNLTADLANNSKATWNPISMEALANLDADNIFLVNSDKGQGSDTLNNPLWKKLPAVQAGHVYEMSSTSSWLYSGLIANEQIIDDVEKALLQ